MARGGRPMLQYHLPSHHTWAIWLRTCSICTAVHEPQRSDKSVCIHSQIVCRIHFMMRLDWDCERDKVWKMQMQSCAISASELFAPDGWLYTSLLSCTDWGRPTIQLQQMGWLDSVKNYSCIAIMICRPLAIAATKLILPMACCAVGCSWLYLTFHSALQQSFLLCDHRRTQTPRCNLQRHLKLPFTVLHIGLRFFTLLKVGAIEWSIQNLDNLHMHFRSFSGRCLPTKGSFASWKEFQDCLWIWAAKRWASKLPLGN